MTPQDRRDVFDQREEQAVIKGITGDDGKEISITGRSLGEAILFVSEGAATDAASVHVVYGEHRSLSYTDCLSIYRDFAAALREATKESDSCA